MLPREITQLVRVAPKGQARQLWQSSTNFCQSGMISDRGMFEYYFLNRVGILLFKPPFAGVSGVGRVTERLQQEYCGRLRFTGASGIARSVATRARRRRRRTLDQNQRDSVIISGPVDIAS